MFHTSISLKRTEHSYTDKDDSVSNDLGPSNLKDFFVPTAKIHLFNMQALVSKNFYIHKSNTEIQRKSLSRIGETLWN